MNEVPYFIRILALVPLSSHQDTVQSDLDLSHDKTELNRPSADLRSINP